MKTKKRLLPALVFSAFAALSAPTAEAAQFSGVYVFGDSLSDAGYYRGFLASLGLPAPVVSQLGRFTTNPGPVWSEIVTQYYGFTPGPSNVGNGNIFAQGGARVTANSTSTPPGGAQRPVSTQITEYLARTGGAADPNALYAVWAGGNDFLQNSQALAAGTITQAELQTNVLGAAAAEVQQIARLRAAGARYIMVFGLPDIGAAPFAAAGGPASVAGATAISAGYNTTLFTQLAGAGIRAIPIDTFALLTDVRLNAAAFGFTNTTGIACGPFPPVTTSGNSQFCLPTNLVNANAAQTYLFADSVHPTAAVHRIIADFTIAMIEGPTQYGLLAESALQSRASQMRMLNQGMATGHRGAGGFGVFVAADTQKFEIDSGIGNSGLDSSVQSAALGLTAQASEAVTVGIAFGKTRNKNSFGQGAGSFRMDERAWSVFASARWGGFYGTGVLSLADIDFESINRNIQLGQVRRTSQASTEGANGSASINAGYDFRLGRFMVGPTVGIATQNVTVNGFDEADAGSAGLRIYEQKRRSEIWSLGVRASLDLGGWTPWVRFTADQERRDDVRFVTATPLSLAAIGNQYDIPAYSPDNKFSTLAFGLNGSITPGVALGVTLYKVSGRSGIKDEGASAVVSVKF
ncbi:MAG TPA: autotransporter domain-containing protein [Usitatibacter sp.]|nr:autotransporter domain-containing protein [Usitatibacter sp.]